MTKYASAEIKRKYFRERRRIQSTLRRAELKPGRMVDRNILPSIPKRVTEASVRRLEKISSNVIQEKAVTAFDVSTGELLGTGRQAINRERIQRYQENIPDETDYALEAIERMIESANANGEAGRAQLLTDVLQSAIASYGRRGVAQRIAEHEEEIVKLSRRVLFYKNPSYVDHMIYSDLATIAGYLNQPISDYAIANAVIRDEEIIGDGSEW